MTFANDHIACTQCDFAGVKQYRAIELVYRLSDGTEVSAGRTFGWCFQCKNVRDIESPLDADQIRATLEELRKRTRSATFIIGSIFGRLLGGRGNEVKQSIASLEAQLRLAEDRRSGPRCLECGSEDTQPLEFNEQGLSVDFLHDCGGRLKLEPRDPHAPRFSYRPETILLDQEGKRRSVREVARGSDFGPLRPA